MLANRNRLMLLGLLTFVLGASLFTGSASAGTFLKGSTCSLYKNSYCQFTFNANPSNPYNCYTRFSVTSAAPYPSHTAGIDGLYGAGLTGTSTTGVHAYSPINYCFNSNLRALGFQQTGSSRTFNYSLQLYSGGY